MITTEELVAVCPRLGERAAFWVPPLNDAMEACKINTTNRISAFIAQCAHESCEFTILEEGFNYSLDRLMKVFKVFRNNRDLAEKYVGNPEAIANLVYANREGNGDESSGDGYRFRGRGIFQITFRNNYRACSLAIAKNEFHLQDNPEFLADPDYACYSAAWYWVENDLNTWADKQDFDSVSDILNLGRRSPAVGDANGFVDRLAYYKAGLKTFKGAS